MPVECPLVKIKDGKLRGFVSTAEYSTAVPVYNFLSIPFGKSTNGKRRFMPPEKCAPWSGILEATETLYHPMQHTTTADIYAEYIPLKNTLKHSRKRQSEDCLKLNLFTPTTENAAKLPVIVWIVGGAFMRGEAGAYDGTALSGMNNVVFVTPNYRVNALGFLSLGRGSKCPGNNGLLDIILALKWIQENIESFGGDPNNVTLLGESAGAVLSHLLMMSSLSEGLFHRVIACSGSSLSQVLFAEDLSSITKVFLNSLGITETEPSAILEKLQEIPIENIVNVQEKYHVFHSFFPTVDGHVIKDMPGNIAKAGKVHKIPFMTGVSDSECRGILSLISPPNFVSGCSKEDVFPILKEVSRLQYPDCNSDALVESLLKAYGSVADKEDKYRYSKIYAEIGADSVFIVPAVMSAISHSAVQAPTYLYYMTKELELNHSETNGPGFKNKLDFVNCDHGDICNYMFGAPFIKGDLPGGGWFTPEEAEFSRVLMRYFSNFAKNGNPNKGSSVTVEWPAFDPVSKQHLVLGDDVTVDRNLGLSAVHLFTDQIPKIAAQNPK